MTDPVPFYPEMLCWTAPLRPSEAPKPDCTCRVCTWAGAKFIQSFDTSGKPVQPGTIEWEALLTLAGAKA